MPMIPLPPMRPKKGGWGGEEVGRWVELDGPTEVGGRCCRCYDLKPAADLRHRQGPFGRWEGWVCAECDPEPRRAPRRSVLKRRPKW